MLRQRSSQVQKCKAAHENSGVKHTQRYDRTLQKHHAARMSRRIAVEQRRYVLGMADTEGLQVETY